MLQSDHKHSLEPCFYSTVYPSLYNPNFTPPTFLWVSGFPFLKAPCCVAISFKEFVFLYPCIELSVRTLVVGEAKRLLSLHYKGRSICMYGEGEGGRKYFIVLIMEIMELYTKIANYYLKQLPSLWVIFSKNIYF